MAKTKKIKETTSAYTVRTLYTNGRRAAKQRRVPEVILPPKSILGKFIVTDPNVCYGKPIFVGTKITVEEVLDQLAEHKSWASIEKMSRGKVGKAAIAEALRLATMMFSSHERAHRMTERDWREIEIINRNAKQLNKEALDVLDYQVIP